jgi:hypothetical protein
MRKTCAVMLAALGLTGLAACQSGPDQFAVSAGDLPPIVPTYRTQIATWATGFYAEPASLRALQISDPVLMRDRTGRLHWLVCIEADARQRGGDSMGVQRQAFGFSPSGMSAPLDRKGSTLVREDCDEHPLVWRPWRLLESTAVKRPARHR